QKGEMIDRQLDKLQDPTRDVMSMEEWRMMADHMGGVEAMGGPAAGLVRLVQAPVTPAPDTGQMHGAMPGMDADSGRMAHDMDQMDGPMKGMAGHAEMMDLHTRMMADPAIRKRIMADSVMRSLMSQMMDSSGAARPGTPESTPPQKHEDHGQPAPAPRPAKPESADTGSHQEHSMGQPTLQPWLFR
ncbi:MAG: hypothetical protein M3Q75_08090, partial [Gemmatimonadota bacterium]|nr:hypothetical protein [Gemmatimonadota bacterium]